MFTNVNYSVDVDWWHGADHMLDRRGVSVTEAMEAICDPDAVQFCPDSKGR